MALLLLLGTLATPLTARADGERDRSRDAFRRGVALAQAGDYASARRAFLDAYRLFPHPSILLNLGIARARTGELVEAEQDLARFLADDGGAPSEEIASARSALSDVRSQLGTLHVRVAPAGAKVSLDGRPVALLSGAPTAVRLRAGAHTLRVDLEGHAPAERPVRVEAGRAVEITVTLAPLPAPEPPRSMSPPREAGSGQRTAGWLALGGAAVGGGAAVFCALRSMSLSRDYSDRASPSFQDASVRSEGIKLRTVADAVGAASVVLGVVGMVLVLTAPSSTAAGDASHPLTLHF